MSELTMARASDAMRSPVGGFLIASLAAGALALGLASKASAAEAPGVQLTGPMTVTLGASSIDKATKNVNITNVLSGSGRVLFDNPVKHTNKPGHETKGCRWFDKGTNTYITPSGSVVKFEDKNVYACADKDSPSGWLKRGGGKTGRDCDNIFYPIFPKAVKPPKKMPVIKGKVVEAGKLGTSFTLHTEAKADVSCVTPNGSASASARGVGDQEVRIEDVVRSRFEIAGMTKGNYKVHGGLAIKIRDSLSSSAAASVRCETTPNNISQGPVDQCKNKDGVQAEVPTGLVRLVNGNCELPAAKDGTTGAGNTAPIPGTDVNGNGNSNPLGTGSPNVTPPTPTAEFCVDPASLTLGDGKLETEGAILNGPADSRTGICSNKVA